MTLAIVLSYFGLLVVIGYLAWRKVRGSTDQYFVAGRSLGTFVNSWAFLASLASGGSMMAGVGTGLALGMPFLAAMTAGAPVGFVVASVLVARPLRRLGKYTVPDYFEARYGSAMMRWLVPILIVAASMAYIVAQLKGASIVASYLLGWEYTTGLWIAGIIFVLYVSIGGFLSVTWNDILQGILMFSMVAGFGVATYAAMNDGYTTTFRDALVEYPVLGVADIGLPVWSYVGAFLTWATAISVLPHVIMRVYSSRDVRSARLSLNWAMLIYGSMMLVGFLILMPAAATLLTDLDTTDPDAAFLQLSEHVFGPVGQGIVAAAVLAAIMSTTAGLLMACNSAIGHDIYSKLIRPEAPEREVVRVATGATWVVGIGAIMLAMNPPEFLIVLYTAAVALLASAFFAPMVLGIWWRRTTTAGALWGMVLGAISFAIAFFGFDMPYSTEILVGMPICFAATIAISLATPADEPQPARVEVAVD